MTIRAFIVAGSLVLACSAANAAEPPVKQAQTALGTVLTDDKGMTLYTFDKDMAGTSACVDACAQLWPPLIAASGAMGDGAHATIKRPDGTMQWAYKGKPLYAWSKDSKPGDTTGDGVKDVWHAARP